MGNQYVVSKVVIYSGESPQTDVRYFVDNADTTVDGEDHKARFERFKSSVLDRYSAGDRVVNMPEESVVYESGRVLHRGPVHDGAMRQIGLGILEKMADE